MKTLFAIATILALSYGGYAQTKLGAAKLGAFSVQNAGWTPPAAGKVLLKGGGYLLLKGGGKLTQKSL